MTTNPPARLIEDGRAFCVAPWTHLAVNTQGEVLPCCEATGGFGNLREQGIDAIWQGEAMDAFRARLRADQPDERCAKCYDSERAGGQSYRRDLNRRLAAHSGRADQPGPVPPPVSLDIRFSNLCNLACRMCWHGSSSRWFADARAMGWSAGPEALVTAFPDVESGLRVLRPLLATVEHIYWAGGEPMMVEEHYRILEELIAMGRTGVALGYTTNATTLRLGQRDALSLWNHFSDLEIEFSIDATGARGALIRHGSNWDRLAATVVEVRDRCPQARIQFGITVSVLNIAALAELQDSLRALMDGKAFSVRIHPVQEPRYLGIRILPRRMKERYAGRLLALANSIDGHVVTRPDGMPASRQLKALVEFMLAADDSGYLASFRSNTLSLDRLRGQETAAICPELAPLLRETRWPGWRRLLRAAWRAPRAFRR